MNFNNFTIKSQEAVQQAVNITQARGQQAIEPVHLLAGVLKVGENVTNFIFQKLGMNAQQIALVIDKQIDSLPKVSRKGVPNRHIRMKTPQMGSRYFNRSRLKK